MHGISACLLIGIGCGVMRLRVYAVAVVVMLFGILSAFEHYWHDTSLSIVELVCSSLAIEAAYFLWLLGSAGIFGRHPSDGLTEA